MEPNKLYNMDCIEGMSQIPDGSIDLAFADPPFNIGYKYDVYEDKMAADEYLAWTKKWGAALVKTLKPDGTAWLAIGDDFAAELKLLFQRELGLFCRSWVIWYYTFGVNCKQKFSRSHTHLFHFVKDPKNFTFNTGEIRVPSARQLVYADSRADSKGRLPDDTWILRPQDAPESFTQGEDVWYFPRVCGTFKERAGWHGCQMPEQLLGRIIKSCSNPGEIVLDPFGGSGTTLAVAKKLGRQFIGFELSKNYAEQIQARLDAVVATDALSGSEEPKVTTPTTAAGKRRHNEAPAIKRSTVSEVNRGIMEAFFAVREGFPVDRIIADPNMNLEFQEMCGRLGLPGNATERNRRLMNLRKANRFSGLPPSLRTTFELKPHEAERYRFAIEIAGQRFESDEKATLDHILCDPALAKGFDQYVLSMIPEKLSSFKIRWLALRIRKWASKISKDSATLKLKIPMEGNIRSPFDLKPSELPDAPGLYWLWDDERHLYVGETANLRERMRFQFKNTQFDFWGAKLDNLSLRFTVTNVPVSVLPQHQSRWISDWNPLGNFERLKAAL